MAAPKSPSTDSEVAQWPTRPNWAVRLTITIVSFAIPVLCTVLLNVRANTIRVQSEAGLAQNVQQAIRAQDQALAYLDEISGNGRIFYDIPRDVELTGTLVAHANHCVQFEQAICREDPRITRHAAEQILFQLSPTTEWDPGPSEYGIAQQDIYDAKSVLIAAERRLARGAPPAPIPGTLEKATLLVWFAFAGFLTWLWLYRDELAIRLGQHKIQLGKSTIPTAQIVGCRVVGHHLEVRLLGRSTYLSPEFSVPPAQLQALAAQIQGMALTRDQRLEEARARLEIERLHHEMSRTIER